jgi:lycopene cyclase domain-containing protein
MPIYLYLDLFTLLGPLALSFDKKVAFFKRWKYLFPAIAPVAFGFIVWDIWFTENGVWSFNPEYLCGLYLWNLPLEEVLFFIVVPYACLFIYDCLNAYFSANTWFKKAAAIITVTYLIWCVLNVIFFSHQAYTFLTSLFSIPLLAWAYWAKPLWLGNFWRAYLVHLIPFFLVNGVLTALPVVLYNNEENYGLRLYTVPVEDMLYSFLLMFGTTALYELFKSRAIKKMA